MPDVPAIRKNAAPLKVSSNRIAAYKVRALRCLKNAQLGITNFKKMNPTLSYYCCHKVN